MKLYKILIFDNDRIGSDKWLPVYQLKARSKYMAERTAKKRWPVERVRIEEI